MPTFTTDTNGRRITLDLDAPVADVTIRTRPELATATVQVTGPKEVVSNVTEHRAAGRWSVRVPDPGPTVITGSNGGARNMVVGSISGGSVVMAGGNVTVSGGTVISGGNTLTTTEPVHLLVTLPEGSNVRLSQKNGEARLDGHYGAVDFRSSNATLDLVGNADHLDADTSNGSITVDGTVLEEIDASATNGTLTLASSAPRTSARATNGSVTVIASGPHRIRARTTNGSLTVLKNGHDADVTSSTTNGSELVR